MRFNDERTKKDTISTELAMRITKVTKLKQRYESFAITLSTNEDNVIAQAQCVIKVNEFVRLFSFCFINMSLFYLLILFSLHK